jgi:hypothetical protein
MLNIGIISYNMKLTDRALRIISENDANSIPIKRNSNRVEMSDGTVYIPVHQERDIHGKRFDQIILVDDYRWWLLDKQYMLISRAIERLSNLFEYYGMDCQVLRYEW